MIDEVVPPLVPGSLVSPSVVEISTNDHELPATVVAVPAAGTDRTAAGLSPVPVWLPDSMLDELQWVAEQEGRDVADIVVNALDEFLADHWSRNADLDLDL
ncbi:hypothetical protein GCM10011575_01310 [Microlunatus endophyticus]|uniref:Ribbon-helix-helix protein, copG family n=1 Tax=Microlunatus endophyticus TaxID=1716077 RepID=A0A917VZ14_9ACTN|nr:hypothetical protein [Microlunatus endophyticus]GGL47244.1 hypothetical protein GCM10011575_01310 [Microlunatus endophyticus]